MFKIINLEIFKVVKNKRLLDAKKKHDKGPNILSSDLEAFIEGLKSLA